MAGFTIAELIIVIAIFALVTSIAMFNQGRLNSNILVNNMAFETALAVREAQVYGIGVRSGGLESNAFSGWFGAHFDLSKPTQIIIFNDINKSSSYDPLVTDEGGNNLTDANGNPITEAKYEYNFTNQRGNKITALCVGPIEGGAPCSKDVSVAQNISTLDIFFKRPSPEAHFHYPGMQDNGYNIPRVYIVVNNIDEDNCRVVIVESTGQIRVENADVASKSCSNPQ